MANIKLATSTSTSNEWVGTNNSDTEVLRVVADKNISQLQLRTFFTSIWNELFPTPEQVTDVRIEFPENTNGNYVNWKKAEFLKMVVEKFSIPAENVKNMAEGGVWSASISKDQLDEVILNIDEWSTALRELKAYLVPVGV